MRIIRWSIGVTLAIAFAAVVLVFPNPRRPLQRTTSCLSNEKQIMLALHMYADEHDDRLPPARSWQSMTTPIIRNTQVFQCPSARGQSLPHYAMVGRWGSASLGSLEGVHSVVLYEVADGNPALRHRWGERWRYDSLYHYLRTAGGPDGLHLGYADGHCKWRAHVSPEVFTEGLDAGALSYPTTVSPSARFTGWLRRLFFRHEETP